MKFRMFPTIPDITNKGMQIKPTNLRGFEVAIVCAVLKNAEVLRLRWLVWLFTSEGISLRLPTTEDMLLLIDYTTEILIINTKNNVLTISYDQ